MFFKEEMLMRCDISSRHDPGWPLLKNHGISACNSWNEGTAAPFVFQANYGKSQGDWPKFFYPFLDQLPQFFHLPALPSYATSAPLRNITARVEQ